MMFARSALAVFSAIVLSAVVVDTAQAYPVSARSGTTTVTGAYRPLNLDLVLVDGTDALSYETGYGSLSFSATFGGTYSGAGTGYPVGGLTGNAGSWQLNFSVPQDFSSYIPVPAPSITASNNGVDTITVSTTNVASAVGSLTYMGLGDYAGVPAGDVPEVGDYFRFFASGTGAFLRVTCQDGVAICSNFVVTLLQDLTHLGPYVDTGEGYSLDSGGLCNVYDVNGNCVSQRVSRVNDECFNASGQIVACGTVPTAGFRVASVPEPASLALVGLGLVAIALGRRRQRPHLY